LSSRVPNILNWLHISDFHARSGFVVMIDHEQFTFSCRSFNSDNFKEYSSSSARYLFIRYHIVLTHKGRSDGVPDIIGLHVTVHAAQLMYLDLLFPDSTIALDTHLGPIMDSLLSLFRPTPPPPSDSARSTNPVQRPQHLCGPRTVYDSVKDVSKRVDFYEEITIFAWPSRGGVIVLERPCPADFDFLGLDRLDPPKKRHVTRQEEDDFAQRLLLLGGKWWDSPARHFLFIEPDHLQDEEVMVAQPEPTARENAWVGAAWPSSGGLVVAEWPTMMYPGGRMDEVAPDDVSRLFLCITMDEKAAVLMDRLGGERWKGVEDYEGKAFIGSWRNHRGEVGELQQTWPNEGENQNLDGKALPGQ
jgi:hypothetical protein